MSQVFVGGAARSGTTVFAARLGRHLGYSTVPEAYFLGPSLLAESTSTSFRGLRPPWRLRTWDLSQEDFHWIQSASSVVDAWTRALTSKGVSSESSWIEHSPTNMRYCSTILKAFPAARFVHLVRDGRAVGASLRRTDFGPHTATAIARWWTESVAWGLAAERRFPDRVQLVRFEDLLADPDRVLAEVAQGLQLDPEPRSNIPGKQYVVGSYTQRHHALVAGELRADRREGWQSEVSAGWVRRFERVAGPMLEFLDYELMYPPQEMPGQISRVLDPLADGLVQIGLKVPRRQWRRWRYAR